ncbi:MAG: hypothetical protein ABI354_02245 [Candidatus Saccharimonadales bacterium]
MLDHHIQRNIVQRLAFTPSLRFSDLQPDGLDNKLFTYHLKKVVAAGLVIKEDNGEYALTSQGRLLGVHALDRTEALADRAYSVLFLVIRRKLDGAWLLYKRKTHPLFGKTGFMHCTPTATEEAVRTAADECLAKTGLTAEFRALGSGFFRIYDANMLESFTNFTLLTCEDAQGALLGDDDLADYYWADDIDIEDTNLLPNMSTLLELYHADKPFFVEKTINI